MDVTKTQRRKILTMLGSGPVNSVEFTEAGILRYSARIHELRKYGWPITGHPIEGRRVWLYKLGD